jgi:hypothetical protein
MYQQKLDITVKTRSWQGLLALVMAIAAPLVSLVYWPGLLTYDSVRQFDQALSGDIDDWHPPILAWIWRQFMPYWPTPAPMLLLQLGLLMVGMVALVLWARREGRPGLALALAASGFLPMSLALMGEILKDCLMSGALVAATGLLALGNGVEDARSGRARRLIAISLIVFAATLRFNGFPATIPLLYALLPADWKRTKLRMGAVLCACLALSVAAMPVANRLIGTKRSNVELSLIIFDLGGITEHSRQDMFPPLGLKNVVAINHGCYSPVKWDFYAWWAPRPCPITFENIRELFAREHINPYKVWISAILEHPFLYLEHRALHWNIETRFLVNFPINRPMQRVSAPNQWGFNVRQGKGVDIVDDAAMASALTPLGWPCAWIALAAGILLASPGLRTRWLIQPLALSALAYGASYSAFGVAAELRYYLWTWVAAALAAVIAIADLRATSAGRRSWLLMFGPVLVVSFMATVARLV